MSLPTTRARLLVFPVLLGAVLAVGGCGSGDSSASKRAPVASGALDDSSAPTGPDAVPDAVPGAVPGAGGGKEATARSNGRAVLAVQALVRKATMAVRVKDVPRAVGQAEQVTAAADGIVAAEQVRVESAPESSADLTLRVPNDTLESFLRSLRDLGTVLSTEGSTEDVTAQVADVRSRVTTQQRSIERVRALLAKSGSIEEIVRVEAELSRREADLESLQAQQRALADRSSLATVTLRIVAPPRAAVATRDDATGFLGGLRSGWGAFTALVVVALTVLGALLPFVLAGALLAVGAALGYRRFTRRRSAPAGTGARAEPSAG